MVQVYVPLVETEERFHSMAEGWGLVIFEVDFRGRHRDRMS